MKTTITIAALLLLIPTLLFAASLPPVGPITYPVGMSITNWQGRLERIENLYETISKFFPDKFAGLTERQKNCLKAKIAYRSAQAYENAITDPDQYDLSKTTSVVIKGLRYVFDKKTVKALREAREAAKLNTSYYRNMQDNWCGGSGDPGLKLYDQYIDKVGQKHADDDLTFAKDALDAAPYTIPHRTLEQLKQEAELDPDVKAGLAIALGAGAAGVSGGLAGVLVGGSVLAF